MKNEGISKDKPLLISRKRRDAALNCSFDSNYSCSDWKKDPYTRSLVNYIQNVQWVTAPLTKIQVEIDTYLQSIGAGVAIGGLLAMPLPGPRVSALSIIMVRIGGQYFAKVVSGSISGAIGAALTLGMDLQTQSKFLADDVLVFENGKIVKIIRNGKEIGIDSLPSQSGSGGSSGGGVSSGGSVSNGGVVGGGGGGGGCFVSCGSVYIRDPN